MTPSETHDALTTESTILERFLHELTSCGNPTCAAVAKAVQAKTAEAESPPCEMKFSLKQDVLEKALTLVTKATSPRSTLEILGHVLMVTRPRALERASDQVILTSTNLETSISLHVDAQIEREGAFSVPAKLLLNCVRTCPKGRLVTIEVEAARVLVRCGTRTFSLKKGRDASEFPQIWQKMVLGKGAPYIIGSDPLRQAIKEVAFAAGKDDWDLVFRTVCLHAQEDVLDVVASDRLRMAWKTMTLSKIDGRDATILIPISTMHLLFEVMPSGVPVIVAWDAENTRAVFQAGQVQVATRLLTQPFPNYAEVLPALHTTECTLERKPLEQIVQAFKFLAQENANVVKLSYHTNGLLTFHTESEELGEADDEVETAVEGQNGHIFLNIHHLADVLKCVSAESFRLYLSDPGKPGIMVPTGRTDYRYLLMPLKPDA